MAKRHYSADSAHFSLYSQTYRAWSNLTGRRAIMPNVATATDGTGPSSPTSVDFLD